MKIYTKESESRKRKWLKDLRIANGLSVNDLSRQLKCDPSYIYRVENGTRNPSTKLAMIYADKLGFDWKRFFDSRKV